MQSQNQLTLQERVNRIIVNLMYLLGEKVAWIAEKIQILKDMIHSFIEGYINASVSHVQ